MAIELVDEICPKDCAYRMNINSGGTIHFCGYAITERRIRGCPVSECPYYVKGKRRRKARKTAKSATGIDIIEWEAVADESEVTDEKYD